MTGTASATSGFELPPELAIETGVARRLIVDFIRSQLQQAGFERLVLGLSGGIDSALVANLAAEAVGPERLLCLLMPYRTSSTSGRTCCVRCRKFPEVAASSASRAWPWWATGCSSC